MSRSGKECGRPHRFRESDPHALDYMTMVEGEVVARSGEREARGRVVQRGRRSRGRPGRDQIWRAWLSIRMHHVMVPLGRPKAASFGHAVERGAVKSIEGSDQCLPVAMNNTEHHQRSQGASARLWQRVQVLKPPADIASTRHVFPSYGSYLTAWADAHRRGTESRCRLRVRSVPCSRQSPGPL